MVELGHRRAQGSEGRVRRYIQVHGRPPGVALKDQHPSAIGKSVIVEWCRSTSSLPQIDELGSVNKKFAFILCFEG